ncbi:MAG: hypothetical protein E7384_01870 [Ruminococcaceae bacterium]|nr:hypothetical protein [Oscillospiraceae bacterium]
MNFKQKFLEELKKIEIWISIAGIITATAIFISWFFGTENISVEGGIAAVLSFLLFVIVCLRFVPEFTEFWRMKAPPDNKIYTEIKTDKKEINITALKVFFLLNFVCFFIIIIVYALRCALHGVQPLSESLTFWECLDSGHYLDIAKDWYLSDGEWDRLVQLVFLPGYPLIIKIFNVLFDNYLYASLAVSSICFGAAGAMFYKLMRIDCDKQTSLRALKFLCLIPGIFFFVAPMSESLFLLCSVSCIYFARKRKWFFACVFGGYAAFTRTLGLVLIVPLIMEFINYLVNKEYVEERRTPHVREKVFVFLNAFSIFLIPAGFAVYCYINYKVSGDPFKFLYYQKEHWSQEFGWFFNTASYQTEHLISSAKDNFSTMLGLWIPNLLSSFSTLVLLIFTVKKLRASYSAYAIAYFVAAIGATWLLSGPRYLLALFVIPVGISTLTENRKADTIFTIVFTAASVFYLYAFVMRWQVW